MKGNNMRTSTLYLQQSEMYKEPDLETDLELELYSFRTGAANECRAPHDCFIPPGSAPADGGTAGALRPVVPGLLALGGPKPETPNISASGTRHLSVNDLYTDISVQLAHVRSGTRVNRVTAYVNLRTDDSGIYNVFLTSPLTDRISELYRGFRETPNPGLQAIVEQWAQIPNVMIGRCRYRSRTGSWSSEFKYNVRGALLAIWPDPVTEEFVGRIHILGTDYELENTELVANQQQYYTAQMEYHAPVGEIE